MASASTYTPGLYSSEASAAPEESKSGEKPQLPSVRKDREEVRQWVAHHRVRSGKAIVATLAVVVMVRLPSLGAMAHHQRRAAWAALCGNRLLGAKSVHQRVYHVLGAKVVIAYPLLRLRLLLRRLPYCRRGPGEHLEGSHEVRHLLVGCEKREGEVHSTVTRPGLHGEEMSLAVQPGANYAQ